MTTQSRPSPHPIPILLTEGGASAGAPVQTCGPPERLGPLS